MKILKRRRYKRIVNRITLALSVICIALFLGYLLIGFVAIYNLYIGNYEEANSVIMLSLPLLLVMIPMLIVTYPLTIIADGW